MQTVTRFKSPLGLRIALWILLLSLVPLGVVYAFMQNDTRDTYTEARLFTLQNQADTYAARLEFNVGNEQNLTTSITNEVQGTRFFILAPDGRYIAHSDASKVGTAAIDDLGPDITRQLLSRQSTTVINRQQGLLLASHRLAFTDPAVVATDDLNTTLTPVNALTRSMLTQLALIFLGMAVVVGLVTYFMLSPASQLAGFAEQLGKKNFLATLLPTRFKGELATVAESLMALSNNIQAMIAELDQKVIDRTSELEYRAVQLKATADVGKAITSVRNLSELLQQTTILINERFGYYHVGIFLLDARKEYAILSASNSEGGRRMLENHHQLKVGETSIVGYVTGNSQARIALDVGQDAVFFDNPDLPATRSEMALPLIASGQILGALDVQSTEPQAFSNEDVVTLQALADQIAVAIQNVNLLNETEKALEAARQVYGEVSRDAWRKVMRYQPRVGFIATIPGAVQTQAETMESSMSMAFDTGDVVFGNDGLTMSIPVKVRGETIGAIRLKKSEISEAWSQDETNLAVALSDQLSGALESARLYRESQQRAARESLVSDISARISASARVDAIVRETVQELGQAIGNAKVTFRLNDQPAEAEPAAGLVRQVTRGNGKSKE
jgi:GAF domain-containing protein